MNDTEYFALQQAKWDRVAAEMERDRVMNQAVEAVDNRRAEMHALAQENQLLKAEVTKLRAQLAALTTQKKKG